MKQPWVPLVAIVTIIVVSVSLNSSPKTQEIAPEAPMPVDVFGYVKDVELSLGFANEAKNLLVADAKTTHDDVYTSMLDSLIATRKAAEKFKTAAVTLQFYTSASDQMISDNANTYIQTYILLASLMEESAQDYEQLVRATDEVGLAEFVANSSKTTVAIDEAWKILPYATVELGYVLVDTNRMTPEGNYSHLRLTREQRERVVDSLDNTYGPEIANGLATGQLSVVASAAILREFLESEWKSADE